MSKLKTRKSVSKRIKKVTRSGQVITRNESSQHRTAGKTKRTLARAGREKILPKVQAANIKVQLGHAS